MTGPTPSRSGAGEPVAIAGTGLSAFGRFEQESLASLAAPVIAEALADAGVEKGDIDMAFVSNAAGALTTGQVAVAGQVVLGAAGFQGIPVFNVENACASSSSALNLAVMAVRSGAARMALVVGVEKLYHAERWRTYRALNGAADIEWAAASGVDLDRESVFIGRVYPARLAAYRERWGLEARTLAEIAVKNRRHAGLNPLAQYRKELTVEDVLSARVVLDPLTTLMCAPIGDGASAVVVTNAGLARQAGRRPVWVLASQVSMGSPPGTGETTIRRLANAAYEAAGIAPEDLSVAEVHDATAFTELLAYEELRFCQRGEGAACVAQGAFSLGGMLPVNPSGGLESRGHPVAATGVAQIVELARQLRGDAGERQVPDARYALAETAGGYAAGDSAAVAIHILGAPEPGR